MKLKGTAAMLAAAFLATGCYTTRFQSNLAPGGAKYEEKGNYFLWGLVGEKEVDLKKLCPAGASRWQNQQTFVDGLLGFITIGIYLRLMRSQAEGFVAGWGTGLLLYLVIGLYFIALAFLGAILTSVIRK